MATIAHPPPVYLIIPEAVTDALLRARSIGEARELLEPLGCRIEEEPNEPRYLRLTLADGGSTLLRTMK